MRLSRQGNRGVRSFFTTYSLDIKAFIIYDLRLTIYDTRFRGHRFTIVPAPAGTTILFFSYDPSTSLRTAVEQVRDLLSLLRISRTAQSMESTS